MQRAKSEYKRQTHLNAVVKASNASDGARTLLLEACRVSDFDSPNATFTKDQICDSTRMSRLTVARALDNLRKEGSIKAIRGLGGGKSVAVTYRLCVVGKGEDIGGLQDTWNTPEEDREFKFKALARKFGALQAIKMMRNE